MPAPEKIKQLIDLLQDKEVQSFLKLFIDNSIVTSDLNILKRLSTIENVLGLNCDFEEEDDHAPTLPEKISILSEKIESLSGVPIKQSDNIPTGKTEIRACKLVERLKEARETAGNKFLSSCDIVQFLKHGLDETLRVKEGQNVRQVKKEVLEKAARMYPDIFISQKTTGRKDLRLVLKT
jgi:hypothetical protein